MATADEQIRVSERVKARLDIRRCEGESYNDVLERVLDRQSGDFEDGFGILSDDQSNWIRERRETAKSERKQRTQRLEDR